MGNSGLKCIFPKKVRNRGKKQKKDLNVPEETFSNKGWKNNRKTICRILCSDDVTSYPQTQAGGHTAQSSSHYSSSVENIKLAKKILECSYEDNALTACQRESTEASNAAIKSPLEKEIFEQGLNLKAVGNTYTPSVDSYSGLNKDPQFLDVNADQDLNNTREEYGSHQTICDTKQNVSFDFQSSTGQIESKSREAVKSDNVCTYTTELRNTETCSHRAEQQEYSKICSRIVSVDNFDAADQPLNESTECCTPSLKLCDQDTGKNLDSPENEKLPPGDINLSTESTGFPIANTNKISCEAQNAGYEPTIGRHYSDRSTFSRQLVTSHCESEEHKGAICSVRTKETAVKKDNETNSSEKSQTMEGVNRRNDRTSPTELHNTEIGLFGPRAEQQEENLILCSGSVSVDNFAADPPPNECTDISLKLGNQDRGKTLDSLENEKLPQADSDIPTETPGFLDTSNITCEAQDSERYCSKLSRRVLQDACVETVPKTLHSSSITEQKVDTKVYRDELKSGWSSKSYASLSNTNTAGENLVVKKDDETNSSEKTQDMEGVNKRSDRRSPSGLYNMETGLFGPRARQQEEDAIPCSSTVSVDNFDVSGQLLNDSTECCKSSLKLCDQDTGKTLDSPENKKLPPANSDLPTESTCLSDTSKLPCEAHDAGYEPTIGRHYSDRSRRQLVTSHSESKNHKGAICNVRTKETAVKKDNETNSSEKSQTMEGVNRRNDRTSPTELHNTEIGLFGPRTGQREKDSILFNGSISVDHFATVEPPPNECTDINFKSSLKLGNQDRGKTLDSLENEKPPQADSDIPTETPGFLDTRNIPCESQDSERCDPKIGKSVSQDACDKTVLKTLHSSSIPEQKVDTEIYRDELKSGWSSKSYVSLSNTNTAGENLVVKKDDETNSSEKSQDMEGVNKRSDRRSPSGLFYTETGLFGPRAGQQGEDSKLCSGSVSLDKFAPAEQPPNESTEICYKSSLKLCDQDTCTTVDIPDDQKLLQADSDVSSETPGFPDTSKIPCEAQNAGRYDTNVGSSVGATVLSKKELLRLMMVPPISDQDNPPVYAISVSHSTYSHKYLYYLEPTGLFKESISRLQHPESLVINGTDVLKIVLPAGGDQLHKLENTCPVDTSAIIMLLHIHLSPRVKKRLEMICKMEAKDITRLFPVCNIKDCEKLMKKYKEMMKFYDLFLEKSYSEAKIQLCPDFINMYGTVAKKAIAFLNPLFLAVCSTVCNSKLFQYQKEQIEADIMVNPDDLKWQKQGLIQSVVDRYMFSAKSSPEQRSVDEGCDGDKTTGKTFPVPPIFLPFNFNWVTASAEDIVLEKSIRLGKERYQLGGIVYYRWDHFLARIRLPSEDDTDVWVKYPADKEGKLYHDTGHIPGATIDHVYYVHMPSNDLA